MGKPLTDDDRSTSPAPDEFYDDAATGTPNTDPTGLTDPTDFTRPTPPVWQPASPLMPCFQAPYATDQPQPDVRPATEKSRRGPARTTSPRPARQPKQAESGPEDTSRLSLFRREGFAAWATGKRLVRPEPRTRAELDAMTRKQRVTYDEQRHVWHSNQTIKTADVARITDELFLCVGANRQHHARMRPAIAIDGNSHLGKTTILQAYAQKLYLDRIDLLGDTLPNGSEHVPVCLVTLSAKASTKAFNRLLCQFYGLPTDGTADQLTARLRAAINSTGTVALIVDDIHFASTRNNDGRVLSNHLKNLAAELGGVTWIYAGIDVRSTGLLDGENARSRSNAQTGRRTTRLEIHPYQDEGRPDDPWHRLLRRVDQNLVLAEHQPDTLVDLALYLHRRTHGYIGGLMNLITRACFRAIASGDERLTKQLLDSIKIDDVSERAYRSGSRR